MNELQFFYIKEKDQLISNEIAIEVYYTKA